MSSAVILAFSGIVLVVAGASCGTDVSLGELSKSPADKCPISNACGPGGSCCDASTSSSSDGGSGGESGGESGATCGQGLNGNDDVGDNGACSTGDVPCGDSCMLQGHTCCASVGFPENNCPANDTCSPSGTCCEPR